MMKARRFQNRNGERSIGVADYLKVSARDGRTVSGHVSVADHENGRYFLADVTGGNADHDLTNSWISSAEHTVVHHFPAQDSRHNQEDLEEWWEAIALRSRIVGFMTRSGAIVSGKTDGYNGETGELRLVDGEERQCDMVEEFSARSNFRRDVLVLGYMY
jgi:hypothetical protein